MPHLKLSKRLEAIYKHIPHGGVADIGTDHGYIPASLAISSYSGRIVAADINAGPLDSARQTASECGVQDKIEFILCDGLSGVSPDGINAVVIAGMGGETIADILSAAEWTNENNRIIIMQPMSKSDVLRVWLQKNGYRVMSEELCENGPIYEILTAVGGSDLPYSPAQELLGHISLISSDPLYRQRIRELILKTERAVEGIKSSSKPEENEKLLKELQILSELNSL